MRRALVRSRPSWARGARLDRAYQLRSLAARAEPEGPGSQALAFVVRDAKRMLGAAAVGVGLYVAIKLADVERQPSQVTKLIALARESEASGNSHAAIKHYVQAINVIGAGPFATASDVPVRFALAECYDGAGMKPQAREAYARVVSASAGVHAEEKRSEVARWRGLAFERLARLAEERSDSKLAAENYMHAVDALVQEPEVLERCFRAWQGGRADPEQAVAIAGEADALDLATGIAKDVAGVLNNLAMLFIAEGEPVMARNVLGRCLAVGDAVIRRTKEGREGVATKEGNESDPDFEARLAASHAIYASMKEEVAETPPPALVETE